MQEWFVVSATVGRRKFLRLYIPSELMWWTTTWTTKSYGSFNK